METKKIKKLIINQETISQLSDEEAAKIKGGTYGYCESAARTPRCEVSYVPWCGYTDDCLSNRCQAYSVNCDFNNTSSPCIA